VGFKPPTVKRSRRRGWCLLSVPQGARWAWWAKAGRAAVTCLSVLKLFGRAGAHLERRDAVVRAVMMDAYGQDEMQALRGDEIAMIFQDQ
jgi:ABC-type microcin C transport system duplicated ATPase subunit YejF